MIVDRPGVPGQYTSRLHVSRDAKGTTPTPRCVTTPSQPVLIPPHLFDTTAFVRYLAC